MSDVVKRSDRSSDIEITPEMIEAGVAVLYRFDNESEEYWAKEIYRAMVQAARHGCS